MSDGVRVGGMGVRQGLGRMNFERQPMRLDVITTKDQFIQLSMFRRFYTTQSSRQVLPN
ncbi:hypothetical protein PGT21_013783 [Puccinia graminis f. sp. tritici]|uniref:Uncharacterized protein n=1 Tax=Puccinia graminis f. sp. tritici TaxID=56615 RepID=A0A5B0MLJ3_PUCGR|nr:hypothetical protein PGT21_013783 [Puccinia graminis f. sp. tritici]